MVLERQAIGHGAAVPSSPRKTQTTLVPLPDSSEHLPKSLCLCQDHKTLAYRLKTEWIKVLPEINADFTFFLLNELRNEMEKRFNCCTLQPFVPGLEQLGEVRKDSFIFFYFFPHQKHHLHSHLY